MRFTGVTSYSLKVHVRSDLLRDLTRLQSIELGDHALMGDNGEDRKTDQVAPYHFKNTVVWRSGE